MTGKNTNSIIYKSQRELLEKGKEYGIHYRDPEFLLVEKEGVVFLEFHAMQTLDWLKLAFSTRLGGVSRGYLSSMNLGWNQGDDRHNVCENYKRICKAIGADYKKLVLSDQIHETRVAYVDENFCGGEDIEKKLQGTDGLMTDVPGLVLATSYADCVPLFFVDKRKKLIAASHSGWKGTVAKIGQKTVAILCQRGSEKTDIEVVIGPSICQDCYEVSEDVAEQFRKAYPPEEQKQILAKGRVTETGEHKYQLDLWAANYLQLKAAGIPESQIHVSGICTCCNHELLFSHRASKGRRGNLNGLMYIRE